MIKYILIYIITDSLAWWVEYLTIVLKTNVQSQVESYQRLKIWYLIPPCLTLIIIKYISRVKWSNPEKGVAPFPTPQCCSYWKGSLWVALDYSRQLYLYILLAILISRTFCFLCYNRAKSFEIWAIFTNYFRLQRCLQNLGSRRQKNIW